MDFQHFYSSWSEPEFDSTFESIVTTFHEPSWVSPMNPEGKRDMLELAQLSLPTQWIRTLMHSIEIYNPRKVLGWKSFHCYIALWKENWNPSRLKDTPRRSNVIEYISFGKIITGQTTTSFYLESECWVLLLLSCGCWKLINARCSQVGILNWRHFAPPRTFGSIWRHVSLQVGEGCCRHHLARGQKHH